MAKRGIQDLFKDADCKLYQEIHQIDTNINEKLFNYFKFVETGDKGYLRKQMDLIRGKDKSTGMKENIEPNTSILPKKTTRQNSTVHADTNLISIPIIKLEKMSLAPSTSDVTRKESLANDMPAPTMLPPRKKKIKEESQETVRKSTRSKSKKKYEEELKVDRGKPSDIIIQNTTVTMIDITDDKYADDEKKKGKTTDEEPVISNETTRSTRTKTRQQKKKAEENAEVESKDNKNEPPGKTKQTKRQIKESKVKETTKRSISNSSSDDKEENKSAQTEYEDAVSNLDGNDPERVEIRSSTMVVVPAFNNTMVVEKPTIVQNDDKDQREWKTPPKTKSKKQQIKEIFSPFDKTSTKKRVEAFEKLGSGSKNTSKIPIPEDQNTEVKTKHYTPFANKFLPKSCSTTRINKMIPTSQSSSSNDSGLSTKTLSALKASQAEYREREKRRQEKEQEAQLKKDALLQAQAEEKRRKREEKQLKAQQQRELIQKEKEEKLQKSKEEAEKKRLLAKNKAKIAKQSESDTKVAENGQTKRTQLQNHLPIYMMTKAPLLPTDDCYDSDDELHVKKGYVRPQWSRDDYLKRKLYTQLVAGEKIKNSLFCCQSQSPDLIEIFEVIDPKKLKRTSSAVWRKPPRYTLFTTTSDILFSEDSDDNV